MNKHLLNWLSEVGYVPGKWRLGIRDNGNEFTGPLIQYYVVSPTMTDGTVLAYQKLDHTADYSDRDSRKDSK
jgi:hypothetical protein